MSTTTSTAALSVLLLNGPNLNLLGTREPGVYGSATLADVVSACTALAEGAGAQIAAFQSNHEGALVDRIQAAGRDGVDAIVINPAAYTHTSVAIRDALLGTGIPFIEVHISNIHAREAWRHHSYLSDKAVAVIAGMGVKGYEYAMQHVLSTFKKRVVAQQ
ncbi:catabolic 3-dehydroquinase 1 [Mycena metata]|uniref:Catabolic 3-dehydroquinase n=1 Tax=Mycena metata TaxID=1033252 RepID=A0AAD7NNH3_9AGAR|nr:catabolic 3-dehydroquinase 1 [Mycena metata]